MSIQFLKDSDFTTQISSIHSYFEFSLSRTLERSFESQNKITLVCSSLYYFSTRHDLLFLWKDSHRKRHASYCYYQVNISTVLTEECAEYDK